MEKPEKSYDAPKTGKEGISTKDLFGFLEWHDDPATGPREKKLLKEAIDAAIDERREVVEKEFEKMIADDPALRAAFESLPAEMTAGAPQSEIIKLAVEFQTHPGLFEKYIQWLDDVASTIGQQRQPAEIIEILRSIGQAEHKKSLSERNLVAQKIICIRQMKKNLRQKGVLDDALTDEAFQKWLRSKRIPEMGDYMT